MPLSRLLVAQLSAVQTYTNILLQLGTVKALVKLQRYGPTGYEPLMNRHFASIDTLEEAQLAQCAALQRQPERIRSTTRFHWWPQRLHARHGPNTFPRTST